MLGYLLGGTLLVPFLLVMFLIFIGSFLIGCWLSFKEWYAGWAEERREYRGW